MRSAAALLVVVLAGCGGSAATPAVIALSGPAQPVGEAQTETFTLTAGTWTMNWSAQGPFQDLGDGFGRTCAVTVSLIGEDARDLPGVMNWLDQPGRGSVVYPNMAAGTYDLVVYFSCPWSVELIGP